LIIGVFGGSLFGHAILDVAAAELDVLFVSLQIAGERRRKIPGI
jgi:hypothetical protein